MCSDREGGEESFAFCSSCVAVEKRERRKDGIGDEPRLSDARNERANEEHMKDDRRRKGDERENTEEIVHAIPGAVLPQSTAMC